MPEPTLFDAEGAPETVYLLPSPANETADGWVVTSLDVGSWVPLSVGDRVVALDSSSRDEWLVEVAAVDVLRDGSEVFYYLKHLADLAPDAELGLDSTRSWLSGP